MSSDKQYDNSNSGALFKNDKEGIDTRPDYRGSCEVNNEHYWVSAWIKTSKAGVKFMSLKFNPKEAIKPKAPKEEKENDDFDDDIPF